MTGNSMLDVLILTRRIVDEGGSRKPQDIIALAEQRGWVIRNDIADDVESYTITDRGKAVAQEYLV